MLCPVLPGDFPILQGLVKAINLKPCEAVWVEPVNPRGNNFIKTVEALTNAGLMDNATNLAQFLNDTARR
jgi:hypothetical protein